ncbi:MAG: helix-turn-helix domain-containing protein, partial [Mycoplasmatales bacterium]
MDNITNSREDYAVVLGNKLKETRIEKKISIDQLAEQFKVSVKMLHDIENGVIVSTQNSYFSRLLCKKYINAIGLDVDEYVFIIDEIYQNDADD